MWLSSEKILFCFVALQIFGQFVQVESKFAKKRGKGKAKAFGAGVLAGGLAGVAMTHLLTRNDNPREIHHHHHIPAAAPTITNPIILNTNPNTMPIPPKPVTTIVEGPTLANGCYKQTIKEPDQNDVTRFIETEQLICPQANPPATVNNQTFAQLVPVVAMAPVQIDDAQLEPKTNIPSVPAPVYSAPIQPMQPQPSVPAQAPAYVPAPAPAAAPISNAGYVHVMAIHPPAPPPASAPISNAGYVPVVAVQPAQPINPAPTAPPQVIVISKVTGSYDDDKKKKKNAAASLFDSNNFALLLPLFVVLRFF